MKYQISAILALVFASIIHAQAALIPPAYISSVVAIGVLQPVIEQGQPPRTEWVTIGTGFFYGKLVQNAPEPTGRRYEVYLVTAKHVVHEHVFAGRNLQIRVNRKETSAKLEQFEIPSRAQPGSATWFNHPDEKVDLSIVQLNFNKLRDEGFDANFFHDDQSSADTKKLAELGASAGDGVFVLGFPMNITGKERSYVIVRQGIIARIAELLEGNSTTFMLDSFVFPGNSGGPVILKPEITAIEGTKSNNNSMLVGLVLRYQSYNDTAYSAQTKRARIVFEENSGLSEVLPVDKIDETIAAWQKRRSILTPLPFPNLFPIPVPAK